jgi:hypothetical protein
MMSLSQLTAAYCSSALRPAVVVPLIMMPKSASLSSFLDARDSASAGLPPEQVHVVCLCHVIVLLHGIKFASIIIRKCESITYSTVYTVGWVDLGLFLHFQLKNP